MKNTYLLFYFLVLGSFFTCQKKPDESNQTEKSESVELTAEEYAQIGRKKLYVDWEFEEAKNALLKAVNLNPDDAVSHANLAWYWVLENEQQKSMEAIKRAKMAEPNNHQWVQWHGWLCYFYDDSACVQKYLRQSIEMQPEQRDAYFILGRMHYRNGNMEEALRWLQRASQDSSGIIAEAMYSILQGNESEGRALMEKVKKMQGGMSTMILVPLYEILEQRDSAFYWLEQNYERRQPLLPWLRYMPILRPLHEDPRFWEMIERIGAPEEGL